MKDIVHYLFLYMINTAIPQILRKYQKLSDENRWIERNFPVYSNACMNTDWANNSSQWLVYDANSTMLQLYHCKSKLIFNEMLMRSILYKINPLSWIDMSPDSNTLCFFFACWCFTATFNTISVISWRSALLVEETGGPGENNKPVASHWQTLPHNVVHLILSRFEPTTSVVICRYCIGSCKSNYNTITATTAPRTHYPALEVV
jgi:hypothetical protein